MSNSERAKRAMQALVAYKLGEWADDPEQVTSAEVEEAISDLLCDLRHLVDTLIVGRVRETLWEELRERGDGHYHSEREDNQ